MTENYQDDTLRIFSLNANRPLAEKIAASVGTELGKSTVRQFSSGEIQTNIEEGIRGDHVYIIQATNAPVDDHSMELPILIDALRCTDAKTVSVILPHYGYVRQNRAAKPREPITAKLVANILVGTGATRLLILNLHTVRVQRFFGIPVDNLFIMPLFVHYYRQQALVREETVVVSPKNNGIQRARSLPGYLDATLAIADHEEIDGVRQEGYVTGNVAGRKCILADNILNVGQTLATTAEALMRNGAQEVYACASHGLLPEGAEATLESAPIKEIGITDSVHTIADRQPATLNIISYAKLVEEALFRTHESKPMSPLFRSKPKGE